MAENKIQIDSTLRSRLAHKLEENDQWVLHHIGQSLQRDSSYPISYLIKKGWIFFYNMFTSPIRLRKCTSVGRNPRTEHKPYVINNGEIHLGDHINICSRNVQCDLVSMPGGKLTIGNDVFVNFGTTICSANKVSIGDKVKIGPYCMIHDTDFHVQGEDFAKVEGVPVIIEENVWLGSRVIVLKGTVIGKGSIIAAGSVVSGIIPPNVIAGGIPARVIRKRDGSDLKSNDQAENFGLSLSAKEKVDEIIKDLLKVEADNIAGKVTPEVESWTAQAHMDLLDQISEDLSITYDLRNAGKLNSIEKIYRWVSKELPEELVAEAEV